jgi:lipoprotein-anchoring transpeptidase ErfK/SrfK
MQELAELEVGHIVRAAPGDESPKINFLSANRPISNQATTVPVLARHETSDGKSWIRVRIPTRAKRRTGWINETRTLEAKTGWHIVILRSQRRANIYYQSALRRTFRIIVGAPSTPTPLGSFFVEENLRQPPSAGIGPYALATSARSSVYQEFAGGPGQIALHGTGRLPGSLGQAVSHGCIRFSGSAITWLAQRIDAGTPVTIQR